MRSALACVLAREEWPAEGAGRVLLASTEALTNAIEHGSPAGGAVEVGLSVTYERAAHAACWTRAVPGAPVPRLPERRRRRVTDRAAAGCSSSAASPTTSSSPRGDGTRLEVGFLRSVAEEAEARLNGDLQAA